MDTGSEVAQVECTDVPQSEPISEDQVPNNAGGFVYTIDDFSRLKRFVILGSNANNYYVSSKDLGLENCECVLKLLAEGHGVRVVEEVTRISREGRAPRQSTGIMVLAICARLGDLATRRAALAALPAVCRTASTLFELVQRCKELGPVVRATRVGDAAADPGAVQAFLRGSAAIPADAGDTHAGAMVGGRSSRPAMHLAGASRGGKASWGRSMRRAIALWYLEKSSAAVAYQATKYSQRCGWSHVDLLRLAHPDPEEHAAKRHKLRLAAAAAAAAGQGGGATAAIEGTEQRHKGSGDASDGADSDWVLVKEEGADADEGEGGAGGGGGASELGALVAAMGAASITAAASDAEEAAAAAEAQRVADMKAIFDFLTHGTLPGQAKPVRCAKRKAAADGGGDGGEGPPAAEQTRPAVESGAAASSDVANTAAAADTAVDVPMSPQQTSDAPPTTNHTTSTANAVTTAPAAAADAPLSPVMQYLVDAHRLRKEIRAPPPLVKPPPENEPGQLSKRRRRGKSESTPTAEQGEAPARPPPDPAAIAANEAACAAAIEQAVSLIRRHRFGHEHVGDTALLRAPELWAAFLEVGMPLTALVRNLGRMTQMGLMERPDCLEAVTRRLRDGRALAAARVHPMTLLEAMCTYRAGAGARGVTSWKAKAEVKQALEEGFYLSFKNVTPTGQRYLIGMDVSGSMCCACAGMTSVTSREAAAAMAMTLVRTDPCKTMAFSHQLVPLELQPNHRLEEVVSRAAAIPMGGTDCALPMLYALERKLPVDVFVVLTDNETWFGKVHPSEALKRYRAAMGLPAKLVVLAFSATNFSIADPRDAGMLDVAGLDSAVPQIVADFAAGRV